MVEKNNSRDMERIDDEMSQLWTYLNNFKDKYNSFELAAAKLDGEMKVALAKMDSSLANTRSELRLEIKSALEPITNNLGILQTKAAFGGALIGFFLSSLIGGFILGAFKIFWGMK